HQGVRARLPSVPTMNSGPAWTTIVSGVNPGRHGIFHLHNDPAALPRRAMHASDRRCPAVWDRLSAAGLPVGVVNVPVTFPAAAMRGVMIAGSDTPALDAPGATQPPGLLAEVVARVGGYELGPDLDGLAQRGRLEALADAILAALEQRLATALYLL